VENFAVPMFSFLDTGQELMPEFFIHSVIILTNIG